jgi:hypothetical protein
MRGLLKLGAGLLPSGLLVAMLMGGCGGAPVEQQGEPDPDPAALPDTPPPQPDPTIPEPMPPMPDPVPPVEPAPDPIPGPPPTPPPGG